MQVRVKICGITRVEDALHAERLGAFAVGFVFFPGSRRYIEPEDAGRITRELGPGILKVGVFVNGDPAAVREIAGEAGLDALQFHGDETPEYVRSFGDRTVIKALRVGEGFDPASMMDYPGEMFLLDAMAAGAYGGTGKSFDWRIAPACGNYGNIIIAGGLSPLNVAEAIMTASPWGVDVSGGVEVSCGVKDHAAMNAFFDAVRSVARE